MSRWAEEEVGVRWGLTVTSQCLGDGCEYGQGVELDRTVGPFCTMVIGHCSDTTNFSLTHTVRAHRHWPVGRLTWAFKYIARDSIFFALLD